MSTLKIITPSAHQQHIRTSRHQPSQLCKSYHTEFTVSTPLLSRTNQMMHVMNPGLQQTNHFRGSQSIPLMNDWAQHQQTGNQRPSQPQQFHQQSQQYGSPIADDPHKRVRGGDKPPANVAEVQSPSDDTDDTDQQQNGKRSRGNTYHVPRQQKPTVTSVVGSLVGGTNQQMRRQLSSGQLDQFMSQGEDKMDEDPMFARERAMSF